jgi:hypothetical protein
MFDSLWLSQVDVVHYPWVASIIQLATAGGFGAFSWYLVIKHIPIIEERHKSERDEWKEYLSKRDDELKGILKELINSQNELIRVMARNADKDR